MMGRNWKLGVGVCVCLTLLSLSASAAVTDPNIITSAAKINSLAEEDILVKNGGLLLGALSHVDRAFVFGDVNELSSGIDFVMTAVDDKNYADLEYSVTVDKAGTLFLLIDNRVGDNDLSNPPKIGNGVMDWVITNGFTETSYSVFTGADGYLTAYALPVTAGTTNLYPQADGTSRLTYLVAAIPDGWNLRPSITGVPASAQVAPGETLTINAIVADYGENTATTILWEQIDDGAPVSFAPDTASQDVTVTFPGEGTYTLKITATDGDGLVTSKTIDVSVQIPTFAVACTNWVEASNDSNKTATTHYKPTSYMYVRNHSAPRRRIQLISYDVSGLKGEGEALANTFLTLRRRTGHSAAVLSVYGVKEELDNFNLDTGSWSNLPGVQNTPVPPMEDQITLASLDLADLSELLLTYGPNVPAGSAWSNSPTSAALDEFLNADNDGTVLLLFVTFTPQDADLEIFCKNYNTAEPETGLTGIQIRGNVLTQTWANNPSPAINADTTTTLSQLSWTNPDAVGDITCDVYIGTGEPNALLPDYGFDTLATGIFENTVSLSGYPLAGGNTYKWIVDVHDSGTGETTRGYVWNFNVLTNVSPTVSIANPIQYLWLGNAVDPATATVVLDATAEDDGILAPLTYLWEQISAPDGVEVVIDPNDVEDKTLILPATGNYVFKVTVDDGEFTTSAAAQIYVGAAPCDAAKAMPGYQRMNADLNNDCYVNLEDFLSIAEGWLDCHANLGALGVPCN